MGTSGLRPYSNRSIGTSYRQTWAIRRGFWVHWPSPSKPRLSLQRASSSENVFALDEYSTLPNLLQGSVLCKLSPNGTITNDKFCLSREVRLHLSHWRLAQRSQPDIATGVSYPPDRDESIL